MNSENSKVISFIAPVPIKSAEGEVLQVSSLMELLESQTEAASHQKAIRKETLINALNYIHFTEGSIFAHFGRTGDRNTFLVKAYPEPCNGDYLTCTWRNPRLQEFRIDKYQFLHMIISKADSIIVAPAVMQEMGKEKLTVQLPEKSYVLSHRQTRRFACHDVIAEVMQSGFSAKGELLDFNARAFRLRVTPEPPCSFTWLNAEEDVTVRLYQGRNIAFSGTCRIIRQTKETAERQIVMASQNHQINRFRKNKFRNPRQVLTTPAIISFRHPFSQKKIQREIHDLSNLGFSVRESKDDCVLVPGMIITDLKITYAGVTRISCTAQVIRREERENDILQGLAILDMDIQSHSMLTHIINNIIDPHTYLSKQVDMEALWEFFFDTNFIYPKKYQHIQSYRGNFKEIYRRLYEDSPEVARHFTYEENGRIYAHVAMLKAYSRTWMVHHLAAKTLEGKLPALQVQKQLMHYLNCISRFPLARTDYVMTYYRPQNRFSDRAYGDFARELNDPQGCSLDLFSYIPCRTDIQKKPLPENFVLSECSDIDLWEMERFYRNTSNGLLLDAMGLVQRDMIDVPLKELYEKVGFVRQCRAYSLKCQGAICAVLIVEHAEAAINLSELLNGFKILVINPDKIDWDMLMRVVARFTDEYDVPEIPILVYPQGCIAGIDIEKQYQLWILNLRDYDHDYMDYMARKFRVRFK
ncbi:MAG: hypothetical protein ACE14T_03455 [Syntrophales bacterium]